MAKLALSGNNNLVVHNDEYVIPMFLKMGLSYEDASTYVGNGCQEVICPNQLHSRAFVYINMAQILLDTLRIQQNPDKMDEKEQKMYQYGRFCADSFEEFLDSYLRNLRSCILVLAEEFAPYEKVHHRINPEPMMSAFSADCIEKGMDMAEGGARYYHKTLSLVGFGTLCDSLLSLNEAYQNGNLEELLNATACSTGATPDGRLSGKPLSRQMNMASPPVLTLAAKSMSVLTEADFHDVGIFDLALPMIDASHYEEAVTDYIRTCL